jgi:cellobiose dehydrogenase (acceptor)
MANNLLVVAWPNGNEIVSSTRWTTSDDYPKPIYDLLTEYQSGYFQPSPYEGPKLTTIKSTVNATHWNWIYRCENCTQWDGLV